MAETYQSAHTGQEIDGAVDKINGINLQDLAYFMSDESINVTSSLPSGVSLSRLYAHRDGRTVVINALLNVSTTYTATNKVFSIPSGFRPKQMVDFDYGGDGGCGRGYIDTNGDISMTLGVSGRIAFAACYCI